MIISVMHETYRYEQSDHLDLCLKKMKQLIDKWFRKQLMLSNNADDGNRVVNFFHE